MNITLNEEKWRRRKFPNRLHIELSSKCNLSCEMCSRKLIDSNLFMNWKLWKKIIDECSEYENMTIFPYWRGESLLHPRFCDFIQYALDKDINIEITTNGTLVNEKNMYLINQMKFINISIHNQDSYNAYMKLLNSRQSDFPILQASFVEGEKTIDKYIGQLIDKIKGKDRVRIYKDHYNNQKICKNINQLPCVKLNNMFVIGANGRISRCTYLWDYEEELDINKMSVLDAWNSDVCQQINSNYPDIKCENCRQWKGKTCGEIYYLQDNKLIIESIE